MQYVLMGLGVVFLVLVLIIVTLFFVIRSKIRKFGKELELMGQVSTPQRIHLTEETEPSFENEDEIKEKTEEFLNLNFKEIATYSIKEMFGVQCTAFYHTDYFFYGVLYEHPAVGVFSDVVVRYEDETSLTVSNAPTGNVMDHMEGHDKIYLPKGTSIKALFDEALMKKIEKNVEKAFITSDAFKEFFEDAYAKEMDWRAARGGATEEEIRRIAAQTGGVSEDAISETMERVSEDAMYKLNEICIENFMKSSNISAVEWEKIRDRVFVVHDKIPRERLINHISQCLDMNPTDIKMTIPNSGSTLTNRGFFEILADALSDKKQIVKRGEIDEPLGADIYILPEFDD